MTISKIIKQATEILKKGGVAEPRREAALLLCFSLKKNRTYLIANSEKELSAAEISKYFSLIERRAKREPFQHITGVQEFYGLEFIVSPDVLIPRPETELIVEHGLKILQDLEEPTFCEVGAGSGCISVSLLRNDPTAAATALDISAKALQIAAANAENHGVASRLKLIESDIFSSIEDSGQIFDLIVSNPPYISRDDFEKLRTEVRDFDPRSALTDEGDGYSIIGSIAANAPSFLKQGGYLLMEIGFGQSAVVSKLFNNDRWRKFKVLPDLQNIPRMVKIQKR